MKLLDLFPTADALFKATHPPCSTREQYDICLAKRQLIAKENAEVLTAFDRCARECGGPDIKDLQQAFFCALDAAIRAVTHDESLGALEGRPRC